MKTRLPTVRRDRSRVSDSPHPVEAVRLVLADSQPLALAGLIHLFSTEPGFKILSTCEDGEQALRAIRMERPDVFVLELNMAKKSGLAVLRDLKDEDIATRAVLITGSMSEDELLEAMRLGVRGLVHKDRPTRVLLRCVRKVHSGEIWLDQNAANRIVDGMVRRETEARDLSQVLTRRELEIVRTIAAGCSNCEIAQRFAVSEGTVKTHVHNIFRKLPVRSRFELIVFARERGLN